MQHSSYPTARTLFITWAVLMALTIGTMIAGKVTVTASIGIFWMAALIAVTWVKAGLILSYYLDLKSARGGWNKLFTALVTVILVIVFALYTGGKV